MLNSASQVPLSLVERLKSAIVWKRQRDFGPRESVGATGGRRSAHSLPMCIALLDQNEVEKVGKERNGRRFRAAHAATT